MHPVDEYLAYVVTAKVFALTAYNLLKNNGAYARALMEQHEAVLTKESYIQYMEKHNRVETIPIDVYKRQRYELVYAPIPQTGWNFISCVSYDYITAEAARINQKTIELTMFIIVLMLGMFGVIVVMLVFVVRANACLLYTSRCV